MAITRLGPNQSVNLASNVTGTLPVGNGGTAITSGFINGTATPGKVLQVISSENAYATSTTSGTLTDVLSSSGTTWETAITPSATSSKILVLVQANISSSVGYSMKGRLMRGSTPIHIGDAASNHPRATAEATGTYNNVDNSYNAAQVNMMYLDSPSTTSATTYKVQYASYATYVVYINRSGADLDTAGYDARTASSITLMEVSA